MTGEAMLKVCQVSSDPLHGLDYSSLQTGIFPIYGHVLMHFNVVFGKIANIMGLVNGLIKSQ